MGLKLKVETSQSCLGHVRPVQEFTGADKTARNRADPTADSSTEGSRRDDRLAFSVTEVGRCGGRQQDLQTEEKPNRTDIYIYIYI